MSYIQVNLPITVPEGNYCETKEISCQYFSQETDWQKNYCELNLGIDMKKDSEGIQKPQNCLELNSSENDV